MEGTVRMFPARICMHIVCVCSLVVAQITAFPGAQGFAAYATGGRGGTIIKVTNLNASGAGSLKAALEASGKRIVVFEVGGVIEQRGVIAVKSDVTVAGESAPSPGITIHETQLLFEGVSNIIIRHLRIRAGECAWGNISEDGHGLSFWRKGAKNIIVDHCTVSWGTDENVGAYADNAGSVEKISITNCITAECLNEPHTDENAHSKGMLINQHCQYFTIKDCLFASNADRNPLVRGDTRIQFVNNVVYNPGYDCSVFWWQMYGGTAAYKTSMVGNVYKAGPSTNLMRGYMHFSLKGTVCNKDNIALDTKHPLVSMEKQSDPGVTYVTDPNDACWTEPATVLPSSEVFAYVMKHAGARPANRDSVDKKIINDAINGTGKVPANMAAIGGFPARSAMTKHTLDIPADPHSDTDGDGYTNVEEWLHTLAAKLDAASLTVAAVTPRQHSALPPGRPSLVPGAGCIMVDIRGRLLSHNTSVSGAHRANPGVVLVRGYDKNGKPVLFKQVELQ